MGRVLCSCDGGIFIAVLVCGQHFTFFKMYLKPILEQSSTFEEPCEVLWMEVVLEQFVIHASRVST